MRGAPTRAVATVLVVGLSVSVLMVLLLVRAEQEAIDRRFEAAVTRAAAEVVGGVGDSVDLLRAADGFFTASEAVTTSEYAEFVEALALAETHPAIAGFAAVGSTTADRVDGFTAAVRAAGQRDFAVRPDPAPRAERRPIVFIEPMETNAAAIGFDVIANPLAAEATDRAMTSGEPALTAPLTLVQEVEGQTGFVIYAPRDPDAAGRQDVTVAYVSAVHRGDDFLAAIFDGSQTRARVRLRDAEGGGPQEDGTIGTWTPSDMPGGAGRTATVERDVLGRTWAIEVAAVPGAFGSVGIAPWLAGVLGLAATLGAAALLRAVQTREEAARRMADELTEDVRLQERRLVEANRDLEHANEQLAASNEELTRFAFVASHDLQEPLRMVTSFLGLLGEHLEARDQLDDETREYVDYAVDGARRMSRLIQDLLVLSRVQRRAVEPAAVDTAAVVEDALALLRARIDESGATVEVLRTEPVVADPTQLLQLVQNLVGNGLKFVPEDRAPLVRVDAWSDDAGDWHLRVSDNGIGVEPEYRDQIFDAFTRLHGRSAYEGTGIGLAVCQRIARAHDGEIRAMDGIDGGLTIAVDLPGAAAAADRDVPGLTTERD